MSSNRIQWVDIARAICIVLVVYGHYFPDDSPSWHVCVRSLIYSFHMPLFMFLSGYLYMVTRKEEPYLHFIGRKARRLLIPYVVTSAIVISIKLITQGSMQVDHPVTTMSFLRMLYRPEAGAFLWFLIALWWMFTLIPLCKTKKMRLALLIVTLALYFIPLPSVNIFCINQFCRMSVFFVLGAVARENSQKGKDAIEELRPALLISLWGLSYYITNTYSVLRGGQIICSILGIWFIIKLSKHIVGRRLALPMLNLISASSFFIYLFHTTFEGFARTVYLKIIPNDQWFPLEVLVIVATGVIGPMITYQLVIKRFRITRFLFGG